MKFKELFRKWVLNNLMYKILAIIIAFVLWLVIVNVQDPEITKSFSIPVQLLNEEVAPEGGFVYAIASGENASIVVSGKRSIVSNLSNSDFSATANFEELSVFGAIPIKVALTGKMSMYSNQIKISQNTTSMMLTLDDISSKLLPINIKYVGEMASDEIIENITLEPEAIEVKAPSTILNTITAVEATINLEDIKDGAELRATPVIKDYAGNIVEVGGEISSNATEIVAKFEVNKIKTVEIKASASGTPDEMFEVSSVTCSFDTVKLKGKEADLEKIEYVRIPAQVLNVTDAKADVTALVNLSEYLPEGVEIYDDNKNVVVTAILKKREIVTTTKAPSLDEDDEKETGDSPLEGILNNVIK